MRRYTITLVCLVLLASAGEDSLAQAPAIKIGLLLPYTGVLSVQGIDTTNSFELYLTKIGRKAGGRAIEGLKEDDEAKPDIALTKIKKLVEEIYPPLNTPDFAPYLAQAGAEKADAVYAWFAGADAIRFVKQYREYGIGEKMPLTGHAVLVDDTIMPAVGDAALGIVTMGSYTSTLANPENKAFAAGSDN